MDLNGHGCECDESDSGNQNNSNTTIINNFIQPNNIISIEIKITDEIITLPDPNISTYDFIQYRKLIDTPRDVIIAYNGLQKAKIYHHRQQTVVFHKYKPLNSTTFNWI
jgi:hypothetical protein